MVEYYCINNSSPEKLQKKNTQSIKDSFNVYTSYMNIQGSVFKSIKSSNMEDIKEVDEDKEKSQSDEIRKLMKNMIIFPFESNEDNFAENDDIENLNIDNKKKYVNTETPTPSPFDSNNDYTTEKEKEQEKDKEIIEDEKKYINTPGNDKVFDNINPTSGKSIRISSNPYDLTGERRNINTNMLDSKIAQVHEEKEQKPYNDGPYEY